MHRASFVAVLAALTVGAATQALAQAPATPPAASSGDGVVLMTVTCSDARKEGAPVTPRMINAALAGRFAVAAGHARLSPDYVQAISDALRRACPTSEATVPETNNRKLIDVAAGVAMPAKTNKDRDFATLTCAQLAPLWKEEARTIVPFLFAVREGSATTPMTKAALDSIGENLPKQCREAANASRKVLDVVKELK